MSTRCGHRRALHYWEDDAWEEQMMLDLAAGKFEKVLSKVDTDIAKGNLRDLP